MEVLGRAAKVRLNHKNKKTCFGSWGCPLITTGLNSLNIPAGGNLVFALATGKGCYLIGLRPAGQGLCCLRNEEPNGKQKPKTQIEKQSFQKERKKANRERAALAVLGPEV